MVNFFEKIQNIGIDTNTDLKSARRIRLGNTMSILGISTGLILLFYAYSANWPLTVFTIHSFIVIATFVPPVLNYFRKNVTSRISFVLVANVSTICLTIVVGPNFNLQYFLFALLGMPFSFFGSELGQKKIFLCLVSILFFVYLEWHFIVFEPLFQVNLYYSNLICIANNIMILLMILLQFYFFVNESNAYIQDITNKSNELKEKNIELEHFAYIASHDLNEPLRTVDSFVDIIREEYEDPKDEHLNTYFTFITDALSRMRLMIDGMLNYSRIGKSGDPETVDINSLIGEIKVDLAELIKEKNVIIEASDLPTINCVQLETRQLFQNLITNATKFQKVDIDPIIKITQKEIASYWQFCLADNGIGIDSKKYKTIFRMFTKLHLAQKYEGHGIGLAFCKKIVEAHNGKIWVESSPGNGSRFYFTIQKKLGI